MDVVAAVYVAYYALVLLAALTGAFLVLLQRWRRR